MAYKLQKVSTDFETDIKAIGVAISDRFTGDPAPYEVVKRLAQMAIAAPKGTFLLQVTGGGARFEDAAYGVIVEWRREPDLLCKGKLCPVYTLIIELPTASLNEQQGRILDAARGLGYKS
jgi:hypothetical protein